VEIRRSYPEDFQFSGERAATSVMGREGSFRPDVVRGIAQVDPKALAGLRDREDGGDHWRA
jgi:hypothetical protein